MTLKRLDQRISKTIGRTRSGEPVEISTEFLIMLNDLFNGKRTTSIGTVVSGVNGAQDTADTNTASIVALDAAYQAADGVVTTAYISADAIVTSAAESANASLSTTLTASYEAADTGLQGDIDTNAADIVTNAASITTEATARADADTAIASTATALAVTVGTNTAGVATNATAVTDEATARATAIDTVEARRSASVTNGLFTNPRFDHPSATPGLPYGWSGWGETGASPITVDKPDNLPGQCMRMNAPAADTDQGVFQYARGLIAGRDYLVSAEIRRVTGLLHRTGLLVQWFTSADVYISGNYVRFATEASTDGIISSAHSGVTRWEKILTAPATADRCRIFAFNSYSGISATSSTPNTYWLECDIKPMQDSVATASILKRAFVGSNGEVIASLVLEAAAGADVARIGLRAADGTTQINLEGDQIFFGPNAEFETTDNTFIIEENSKRNRFGSSFGASGDLLEWFGPTSVGQGSETKTNGYFAKGTDGKVYYGTAELGGSLLVTRSTAQVTGGTNFPGNATTGAITVTATGGAGSYVYDWDSLDAGVLPNSATSATTTFTRAVTNGGSDVYTVYCDVSDADGTTIRCTATARFTDTT